MLPNYNPLLLMSGTSSKGSYLVFARRGDIALGIKPEAIFNGVQYGQPDCSRFTARLRSAKAPDLFKGGASEAPISLTIDGAWSGIVWENVSHTRASTLLGVMLEGRPTGDDPSLVEKFYDEIEHGKFAIRLTAYLRELVEPQYFILTDEQIQGWLDKHYLDAAVRIRNRVKAQEEQAAKAEQAKAELGQVGTFGMQAAVLKKFLSSKLPDQDDDGSYLPPAEGDNAA